MAQKTVKKVNTKNTRVVSTAKLRKSNGLDRSKTFLLAVAVALIGAIVLIATKAATTNPPILTGSAPAGYSLKWADEFNGSTIDTTKWNNPTSNFGSGNNEDQCFLPSNASVSGGNAVLTARRVSPTKCGSSSNPQGNGNYHFTSAMLSTRANEGSLKYEFKKGYVEANIKMPAGNPFWMGFWLVGGSGAPGWPAYGEMDITELISMRPDITNGTFHYKGTDGTSHLQTAFSNRFNMATTTSNTCYMCSANFGTLNNDAGVVKNGAMQNYHRYGLLWEDNRITWYLDGYPYRSVASDGTVTEYYGPNATPKLADKKATAFDANTFGYNHTILLTNSVGGNFPKTYGFTGGENADGSYNNGNLNVLKNIGDKADTLVDYVRVYQYTGASSQVNTAPTVNLTAPTSGQTFENAPAAVTLNATATDADGIKSVEFFDGATSVGIDTTSPYSVTVSANAGPHTYTAKATDNNSSSLSTTSSATSITVNQPVTTTTLAVPSNIKATPGNGQVTLTWDAVAGANNYTVRWGTGGNYPNTNYSNYNGAANPTTNTYTVTGLTNGTTYNFSLKAKDSTLAKADSAYSTVNVLSTPYASTVSAPLAPASVSMNYRFDVTGIFSNTYCKLDVSWPASTSADVTSYEYSFNTGKPKSVFGKTSVTGTVTNGTTYTVYVKAVNSSGLSSTTAATATKTANCY